MSMTSFYRTPLGQAYSALTRALEGFISFDGETVDCAVDSALLHVQDAEIDAKVVGGDYELSVYNCRQAIDGLSEQVIRFNFGLHQWHEMHDCIAKAMAEIVRHWHHFEDS